MTHRPALIASICLALLTCLPTSAASIEVYAVPDIQTVDLDEPAFSVSFFADLEDNEVVAWALDFDYDATYAELVDYEIAAPWDQGGSQPDDPDVLDVGALAPFEPGYITGNEIPLITLNFTALGTGELDIMPAAQAAELEGFALNSGVLATQVLYQPARVQIVPEPNAASALVIGLLGWLRRR